MKIRLILSNFLLSELLSSEFKWYFYQSDFWLISFLPRNSCHSFIRRLFSSLIFLRDKFPSEFLSYFLYNIFHLRIFANGLLSKTFTVRFYNDNLSDVWVFIIGFPDVELLAIFIFYPKLSSARLLIIYWSASHFCC